MKRIYLFLPVFINLLTTPIFAQEPVRIGIDGLSHSHVHGLLNAMSRTDIRIVGIAENDQDLAQRYAKQYGFDMGIVYNTVEEMVEKTKPEGVLAFNSIYDHLRTVEACAPRGIHVMVEKPLAVSVAHAERIAKLARQYNTLALTNYETTWYPTNHKAFAMAVTNHELGDIRKVIICDGHQGPKEIGCNAEFLAWLTDPKLNGGGAVIDFGCYGANLMTWLMRNQRPVSVSATLQHIKPDVYPKVDDEATIVLAYPHAQAIIQASWNWPASRKDMEIYGATGYAKALNAKDFVYRLTSRQPETGEKLSTREAPEDDPFRYFAAAVRGTVKVAATDLSSLENNLIVVEILEAARKSAASGKAIKLK
jgi:predicted dehydrogenase